MVAQEVRSLRGRLIAPVVALVIASGSIGLAIAAQRSSERQERDLLRERTSELAALLTVSTGESRATLLVAGTAMVSAGGIETFEASTAAATISGTTTIGVVRNRGGAYAVVAAAGKGAPEKGTVLGGGIGAVLARAQDETSLVSAVLDVDGDRHVVLALSMPADRSYVAYLDARVDPSTPAPASGDSPYRELNVALYAGAEADPDRLVLVSGGEPGNGSEAVTRNFEVGADPWTLVVSAREPLIGSQAEAYPWLVGTGGLLTAVILGLLIETLVRRRSYALHLVEERTRLLQEAQREAERANEAREAFFASVSHDIRAPLTAIMGFAELMPVATPEQQEEFVQRVRSNVTTLGVMVDNMLDHARLHAGALEVELEPLLLEDLVEDCLRDLEPVLRSHRISVRGAAVTVMADRLAFRRVLANVLVNAVRYSPPGTPIEVELSADGESGRVAVADRGRGIAEEDLESIFDEFARGSRASADGGSGLGLFSVHQLVHAQRGSVGIASTPGEGTTVTIELPLVEAAID